MVDELVSRSSQYHVFNAAVCLGTLLLRSPRNLLVDFALNQIDTSIALLQRVVALGKSSRVTRNLEWLVKLRSRIEDRIKKAREGGQDQVQAADEGSDDEGLLGWRTRLVERATRGSHKAVTIRSTPSPHSLMTDPFRMGSDVERNDTDQLVSTC